MPTAASPSNTNSSSSSNTGSQSGTLSTSLSNTTNTNTNMGPNGTVQNQNQQGGEQLSKTNLYIRGLQQGTTDKDLVNMCAQWVQPGHQHNISEWASKKKKKKQNKKEATTHSTTLIAIQIRFRLRYGCNQATQWFVPVPVLALRFCILSQRSTYHIKLHYIWAHSSLRQAIMQIHFNCFCSSGLLLACHRFAK